MHRKVIILLIYRNDETSERKLSLAVPQFPFTVKSWQEKQLLNAQSATGTPLQLHLEANRSKRMINSSMKLLSQPRQFTV
jgi:hypothetical protein